MLLKALIRTSKSFCKDNETSYIEIPDYVTASITSSLSFLYLSGKNFIRLPFIYKISIIISLERLSCIDDKIFGF